jgi:hypothetical protein
MEAYAWRLCPAGKTASTVANVLFPQVNGLDLGAGILHAIYQVFEHQLRFALPFRPRTGINGQYFHNNLLPASVAAENVPDSGSNGLHPLFVPEFIDVIDLS